MEPALIKHLRPTRTSPVVCMAFAQIAAACLAFAVARKSLADDFYLPDDDSVVLEILPDFLKAGRAKFVEIQDQLRENPADEKIVEQVVSLFIDAGENNSDPRYLGIARTILDPWWESESVTGPILLLRARIKEHDRQYDEAIADLIKVNSMQPSDGRELISLARLYALQGQYGQARDAAKRLEEIAGTVAYLICLIPIDVMTGNTKDALAAIESIEPDIKSNHQVATTWLNMTRAKIAEALGNVDQADGFYREGLKHNPDRFTLKKAYADFLIAQERGDMVVDLLKDHSDQDAVLLKMAIAAKLLGEKSKSEEYTRELTARIDAIRRRGDYPDQRISARYYLDLISKPKLALRDALANWENRKELEDSRLVLRAALAAKRPTDALPVKRFLRVARTEDVISQRLISELESL